MLYLQATKKVLVALGVDPNRLGPPGEGPVPFGNWIINLIPIGSRQAYLFVNCRTLLSFPIMIGRKVPELQDMPAFLNHGIVQFSESLKISGFDTTILSKDVDRIALCVNEDKSLLGIVQALAADYEHRTRLGGKLAQIIDAINSTPRAKLGYKSSVEITKGLLHAGAA